MDAQNNNIQNLPIPPMNPQINVTGLKAQIDALSTQDNDALIEMMGGLQDFPQA